MTKKSTSLTSTALQNFKKSKLGIASLFLVIIYGFIAVFGYVISPDNSQNANQMHVEIHSKSPGFSSLILETSTKTNKTQSLFNKWFTGDKNPNQESPIHSFEIKGDSLHYLSFTNQIPKKLHINENQAKVTKKTYYLGTDKYGRDLLSRLLIGTRISFFIGFIAVFISLVIGISIGSLAGYYGGKVDAFLMWIINITWSIPTLLLVIAITLALGKGYWQVFIAVGLTMWVEVARVVRGQVITIKQQQYVEAAKALGYSSFRIIKNHILPNILAPVIVISAANFAAAILIESGLSFLGIGAQPPTPSWGAIIKNHYNYIVLGKPFLAIIPGMAIMSLVMSFMLIGNTLRDALDVKN